MHIIERNSRKFFMIYLLSILFATFFFGMFARTYGQHPLVGSIVGGLLYLASFIVVRLYMLTTHRVVFDWNDYFFQISTPILCAAISSALIYHLIFKSLASLYTRRAIKRIQAED